MASKDEYEILPAGEMQKKYDLYAENREIIKLDPNKVPEAFRHLIPFAERWGEGDDIIRDDMIKKASAEERFALKRVIVEYDNLLDDWLAGPEALGPKYSDEYSAFSNMRMAAYGIT
jgi:hypothetical protein